MLRNMEVEEIAKSIKVNASEVYKFMKNHYVQHLKFEVKDIHIKKNET